jgi:hypothetical protein
LLEAAVVMVLVAVEIKLTARQVQQVVVVE